ncbi:ABC transporter ATP-binding protein [Dactylosporangium sp. CA-139066]|uniref:ABC transporter ATP-binding protein n=1 Tax=Dactylosporangium sp. CA-139066 TaxID=3239930 RepID=UPI003D8B5631
MPFLEVQELGVHYGGIMAVRRVDLAVEEGQVFVVLGPNGAGKTSTVRAISGLIRGSAGRVVFNGKDISRAPSHRIARAGLVMVPEGRRIFAPLSVEENLLIGGYANKDARNRESTLASCFEMFPVLRERRNERAGLLSGGEQQMLAFGRALMADPKMILMDEPSMGLSPAMVDQIMASVAAIAARGIAILMVEQNAAAALPVATDAVVLERGEIVLRGSARELASHPDVVTAFLGESAGSRSDHDRTEVAG